MRFSAILASLIFVFAACGEKPINHGYIVDISHYPETVVNGQHNDEHCTITILEDKTGRSGEIEIPCDKLKSFKLGDWWLRKGVTSPDPKVGQE